MPETLAGLERLLTARAGVRPRVRVGSFVRAHRCRVLKPLPTDLTLFPQFIRVFEQHMLLEMIALFKPDKIAPSDSTA